MLLLGYRVCILVLLRVIFAHVPFLDLVPGSYLME